MWRDVAYDARELTADERLTTYLTKLENDQSARRTVRANNTERGRACPCACAYAQF